MPVKLCYSWYFFVETKDMGRKVSLQQAACNQLLKVGIKIVLYRIVCYIQTGLVHPLVYKPSQTIE